MISDSLDSRLSDTLNSFKKRQVRSQRHVMEFQSFVVTPSFVRRRMQNIHGGIYVGYLTKHFCLQQDSRKYQAYISRIPPENCNAHDVCVIKYQYICPEQNFEFNFRRFPCGCKRYVPFRDPERAGRQPQSC